VKLLDEKLRDKRMKPTTWLAHRDSDVFESKRSRFQERHAEFGVIDELGMMDSGSGTIKLFEGEEVDMVTNFWEYYKDFIYPEPPGVKPHEWSSVNPAVLGPLRGPAIMPGVIGFNILVWQLPFLMKRTALLGLQSSCKFELNKEFNTEVYDCGIRWIQSKYDEPDLDEVAVYFGLDQENPTLEQEIEMIWQIYHRIQNLL
jgi:hypothetical protein